MKQLHNFPRSSLIALAILAMTACNSRDDNTTTPSTTPDNGSITTTPPTSPPDVTSTPGLPEAGSTSSAPEAGTGMGSGMDSGSSSSSSSSSSSTSSSGGSGANNNSSLRNPTYDRFARNSAAAAREFNGVEIVRVASTDTRDTTTSKDYTDSKLARADRKFIEEAGEAGLYEVEAARVATERATDPAVKSYAQMLVTQHSDANAELKQLAESKNVKIDSELSMLKRRTVDGMRKTSSAEFDRDFVIKVGIRDHEKDIKLFEKASRDAKDPEVRAWAEKKLPALREHLAEARKLPVANGMTSTGTGMDMGSGKTDGSSSSTGSGTR